MDKTEAKALRFVQEVQEALQDKSDLTIWEQALKVAADEIVAEMNLQTLDFKVKTEEGEVDWGDEFAKCVRNPLYFYRNYIKSSDVKITNMQVYKYYENNFSKDVEEDLAGILNGEVSKAELKELISKY